MGPVVAAAVCVAGICRRGTWRHRADIDLPCVWQALHLVTSTFTLCGRHGTWKQRPSLCVAGVALIALGWLWWHAWVPFDAVVAAAVCVAGICRRGTWRHRADIDLHCVWQALHLVTSTFTLCGRHGTWRQRPSLCVAGVALMALGWLWWHAWVPFDAVVAAAVCVAGICRRGTWRHQPSLCVAGVALGDIDLHFVWQVWRFVTSTFTLFGRRGTCGTELLLVLLFSECFAW